MFDEAIRLLQTARKNAIESKDTDSYEVNMDNLNKAQLYACQMATNIEPPKVSFDHPFFGLNPGDQCIIEEELTDAELGKIIYIVTNSLDADGFPNYKIGIEFNSGCLIIMKESW